MPTSVNSHLAKCENWSEREREQVFEPIQTIKHRLLTMWNDLDVSIQSNSYLKILRDHATYVDFRALDRSQPCSFSSVPTKCIAVAYCGAQHSLRTVEFPVSTHYSRFLQSLVICARLDKHLSVAAAHLCVKHFASDTDLPSSPADLLMYVQNKLLDAAKYHGGELADVENIQRALQNLLNLQELL